MTQHISFGNKFALQQLFYTDKRHVPEQLQARNSLTFRNIFQYTNPKVNVNQPCVLLLNEYTHLCST
jgi:hypothetical protein